jgi:hypothetical protein
MNRTVPLMGGSYVYRSHGGAKGIGERGYRAVPSNGRPLATAVVYLVYGFHFQKIHRSALTHEDNSHNMD